MPNISTSFTYKTDSGNSWGIISYDNTTGWVFMTDLLLVYDNISFIEEYESEFNAYNKEYDTLEIDNGIIVWTYPLSGVISGAINIIEYNPEFRYTYTDTDGRIWGYVPYYMGHKGWICFSAPTDDTLPQIIPPINEIIPSEELNVPPHIKTYNESTITIIIIVLIVILVATTALLIRKYWSKN